jgi:glycerol-3-phosphate dehydrogenase
MLRLGLFLYDHIGGRGLLPPTRTLDMRTDPAGKPLKPGFTKAFEYSDGWVDDARLVVLNARDAADRGAVIRTRAAVTAARRDGRQWVVSVKDAMSGHAEEVRAHLLVNAAGPWIDRVLADALGRREVHNVRLVQGSHIVVPRKSDDPRAYFFQNRDGRILFAIPYENDFTLVGTTDRDFSGDPREARITQEEIAYLCGAASEYFSTPVLPGDVVRTYSGVRPLYDDGASKAQEATRDYVLTTDAPDGEAPLLNVVGGKITTYRRLAEAMLEKVEGHLGRRGAAWTKIAPLPGGDFPATGFDAQVAALRAACPFLGAPLARRLTRLYGTVARDILGSARSQGDLGRCFGADLYEAEVRHLVAREWARTAEDILWRRTKLGFRLTAAEAAGLRAWLDAGPAEAVRAAR